MFLARWRLIAFHADVRSSDPRADNLLSRLFSYSPRVGRSPLEDYCTEALAWCLRASTAFRGRFLELTGIKCLDGAGGCCEISTQVCFSPEEECDEDDGAVISTAGRFDMIMTSLAGTGFAVVLEVKVRAGLGDDQLKRYRRELGNGVLFANIPTGARWVVTLTNAPFRNPLADGCIQWRHVERALRASIEDSSQTESIRNVLRQFANFLGEHGMNSL